MATAAVLIPIKSFDVAKGRLTDALEPAERAVLAERMAERVVRAAAPLPVFIVCGDESVRAFAERLGARVIWREPRGLNAAVTDGVEHLRGEGVERVIIAHADLPRATSLAWVAKAADVIDGVVLVPDRRNDGSNVMCLPTSADFVFAYGVGSAAAHEAEAHRLGLRFEQRIDADLGWDVDTPEDLAPDIRSLISITNATTYPPTEPAPKATSMTAAQNPLTPAAVRFTHGTSNLPTPERALAIGAHPDDVDFFASATLAKWAADGCEVSVLVCTDGSKGTWDPDADQADLIATREREQEAAARAFGATGEVGFLRQVDGELESTLVQRAQVAHWIRKLRPNVVLGHDPWKRYRLHPDHRNAGLLACEGIVAARDPKFFPDQEFPHHRPDALLLWEADEPDHAEDVQGFVQKKYDALLAHESQFESTMKATNDDELNVFRARVLGKLEAAGAASGFDVAEIFKLIDDL